MAKLDAVDNLSQITVMGFLLQWAREGDLTEYAAAIRLVLAHTYAEQASKVRVKRTDPMLMGSDVRM